MEGFMNSDVGVGEGEDLAELRRILKFGSIQTV